MENDPSRNLPRRVSLVAETARALREGIIVGTWQDFLPGERELCSHLQVSRPTLRSALKELEQEGVLEGDARKRRRVLSTPDAQNITSTSRVVAAISPRSLSTMAPSAIVVVDELRTSLARAGIHLEMIVNSACYSANPARALEKVVAQTPAVVWLMFGSREPMQRWFLQNHLPGLIVGSSNEKIPLPSVDIDYRATCRHAGGILRSKGHRNFALILPDSATGGEADSETGFLESAQNFDDTRAHVIRHDGSSASLCARLENAMQQRMPPTAFVIGRGAHVLTVLTFLLRNGISVPDQVSLISRDFEEYLEHVTPAITCYSIEPARITRIISRIVRDMMDSKNHSNRQSRLMPDFLPGETLAKPPHQTNR